MSFDNTVNAISRPLIGFFIGMALGFIFQLAQSVGLIIALGWALALAVLFGLVMVLDRFLNLGFDSLTGVGVKSPKRAAGTSQTPHWFVRFGWIIGMIAGALAVFFLPEEMLAWLS